MEKGNAVDPAAVLAAVPVGGIGDRVTSAVLDVTAETADSIRGKLIETGSTAAVDELRERIRPASGRDEPAEDDPGTASSRPDNV
jgi:hypothetical protein